MSLIVWPPQKTRLVRDLLAVRRRAGLAWRFVYFSTFQYLERPFWLLRYRRLLDTAA